MGWRSPGSFGCLHSDEAQEHMKERLIPGESPMPGQALVSRLFPEVQCSFGFDAPERSELGWIQTACHLRVTELVVVKRIIQLPRP